MLTGLHESLAGRFMPVDVGHWSYPEMAATFGFSLDQYLFFGGYPGVAEEISDLETWRTAVQRTIISPGIERDVIALSRVGKPALIAPPDGAGRRVFRPDPVLQQDARSATGGREHDDAGPLPRPAVGRRDWSPDCPDTPPRRYIARGSSPKLNVLNTALMTVMRKRSFEEVRADRTLWGRIVESAVGAHLHNTAGLTVDLHHWREGPHEIDFVLSRGTHPMGIEVKSGSGRGKRRGQEAFQERFPGARTLLVGERGVPLEEFLSRPARYWVDYEAGPPGSANRLPGTAGRPGFPPGTSPSFRAGRNRRTTRNRRSGGSSWRTPGSR